MLIRVTDFSRSQLAWRTKAGSNGFWRLIASASRLTADDRLIERVVLTPMVMAGNVYGTGHLFKEPSYTFQVIASDERHTFLRNPSFGTPAGSALDSSDRNRIAFEQMRINIATFDGNAVTPTPNLGATLWPLTANIRVRDDSGETWLLEFPVDHLNIASSAGTTSFQVETGPILVPNALIKTSSATVVDRFGIAYLFFNRLDRFDLAVWGPRDPRTESHREFRHFDRVEDGEIRLFTPKQQSD